MAPIAGFGHEAIVVQPGLGFKWKRMAARLDHAKSSSPPEPATRFDCSGLPRCRAGCPARAAAYSAFASMGAGYLITSSALIRARTCRESASETALSSWLGESSSPAISAGHDALLPIHLRPDPERVAFDLRGQRAANQLAGLAVVQRRAHDKRRAMAGLFAARLGVELHAHHIAHVRHKEARVSTTAPPCRWACRNRLRP